MVCAFICSSGLQLSLLLKKGEGGGELTDLVITSSDSDGYFRFILIGLYLACLLYNNHR